MQIRQAIRTRYHGPTNRRGSRVSAACQAKRVTFDWDHALNPDENHLAAAHELQRQMEWAGTLVGGGLHDGTYAWVFLP